MSNLTINLTQAEKYELIIYALMSLGFDFNSYSFTDYVEIARSINRYIKTYD